MLDWKEHCTGSRCCDWQEVNGVVGVVGQWKVPSQEPTVWKAGGRTHSRGIATYASQAWNLQPSISGREVEELAFEAPGP
ncbi:hypothetical protein SKAU_G00370590 [Synaphobranchus kaupii]|uniref:Uncharacterized protein n=1 Tax=Synaphobranchus kaupii TaxID=118154 RepID=A0A9Q1EFX7_SYNKA|nr:hypothetical protein SKAU_G00370590 [Synaphobranchus kaupii]